MMNDEPRLSEAQAHAVVALHGLVHDPSPESRARILTVVRGAISGSPAAHPLRPHVGRGRRVVLGAAAGLALLAAGGSAAVIASADALPGGPGYSLRSVNEQVQLLFATPADKERLRLSFSERRLQQAKQELMGGDRRDAATLLEDGTGYLAQAQVGLGELRQAQRSEIENRIASVQSEEHQVDGQLQQNGGTGQQSGTGSRTPPSQAAEGAGPTDSSGDQPGGAGAAGPTLPAGDVGPNGGGASAPPGSDTGQPSVSASN